jgi:hypothetical protein
VISRKLGGDAGGVESTGEKECGSGACLDEQSFHGTSKGCFKLKCSRFVGDGVFRMFGKEPGYGICRTWILKIDFEIAAGRERRDAVNHRSRPRDKTISEVLGQRSGAEFS